jgi:hypothetical protein
MSTKPTETAVTRLINACRNHAAYSRPVTVCFVCFGNIIRSQAARAFAQHWLAVHPQTLLHASSAG